MQNVGGSSSNVMIENPFYLNSGEEEVSFAEKDEDLSQPFVAFYAQLSFTLKHYGLDSELAFAKLEVCFVQPFFFFLLLLHCKGRAPFHLECVEQLANRGDER